MIDYLRPPQPPFSPSRTSADQCSTGGQHRWLYIPAESPNDACNRCGAVRVHDPNVQSLDQEIAHARATTGIPPMRRG
jgi:hypothetical protein